MARDSWRTADWRDKLRVWVSRTGWRPADVAASDPREKIDPAHFVKYDPRVPGPVSLYALFQLVAAVLLLNFMENAELAYGQGVALWALLVATTVTTALWLEGRGVAQMAKWELLRLGGVALLFVLAWQQGQPVAWLAALSVYGGLNLLLLSLLLRLPRESSAAPAH